jgi:hypothetical protein
MEASSTIEQMLVNLLPFELLLKVFTHTSIETKLAIRNATSALRVVIPIDCSISIIASAITDIYCFMLNNAGCESILFDKSSWTNESELFFTPVHANILPCVVFDMINPTYVTTEFITTIVDYNGTFDEFSSTLEMHDNYVNEVIKRLMVDLKTSSCMRPRARTYHIWANIEGDVNIKIPVSDGLYEELIYVSVFGMRNRHLLMI